VEDILKFIKVKNIVETAVDHRYYRIYIYSLLFEENESSYN